MRDQTGTIGDSTVTLASNNGTDRRAERFQRAAAKGHTPTQSVQNLCVKNYILVKLCVR